MNSPLVSIIVPSYNASQYLPEMIDSVINQTYRNWEMLIVDDGSTDNTLSIAQGFAAKDPRIKVFPLGYNSGGPAKPRNYAMQIAEGSYLAFLDADDLWLPQKLEKQVEFLENNQDIFLLYSKCIIERNGVQLGIAPQKPQKGHIFNYLFLHFNIIDCLTVVMRNRKEKNIYFFDEDRRLIAVEDFAMWVFISYYEKISFIDEPLAIYRVHSKGISFGAFSNFKKCKLVLKKFSPFVAKLTLYKALFNFYRTLIYVGIMVTLISVKKIIVDGAINK